jgi:hypothetical protein
MPRLRFTLLFAVLLTLFLGAVNVHAAAPPAKPVQLAELTPSMRQNNDWFGFSVAVSGNTMVVTAFDPNIEQYGTAYVYVKPTSGWTNMTQVATLTSSDNGQGFGTSVSISGNTIVIGAADTSNFDPQAAGPGAAYVFVEPTGGWVNMTESAKLTASDGQSGDAFGDSVGIVGGTIGVGAFFAEDKSGNDFAGKAYVFTKPASGWTGNLNETAILTASDSELLNYMGASIAVTPSTVVAGAYGHNNFQGAAYVFVASNGHWTSMAQTAELAASDGKSSADFGFSSATNGKTIVEGAVSAASGKGAAYVFEEPTGGWINMTQTAELRAPHAIQGDGFGQSAAMNAKGTYIAIGAPSATVGANELQGAAYVFKEPSTGWRNSSRAAEFTSSDGAANDSFGISVSLSGSTAANASLVAGAVKSGPPGSAYVFGVAPAASERRDRP